MWMNIKVMATHAGTPRNAAVRQSAGASCRAQSLANGAMCRNGYCDMVCSGLEVSPPQGTQFINY